MVQWNKPKGICDEDTKKLQGWLATTQARWNVSKARHHDRAQDAPGTESLNQVGQGVAEVKNHNEDFS